MSDPSAPPPPSYNPPPPPPAGPGVSQNRGIMIVLSYLSILFLVPLLIEKDDKEVQWHAKHGAVLFVVELILWVAIIIFQTIVGAILHFLICLVPILWGVICIGIMIVHIVCIIKGLNGQRFIIPGISQYADRF